MILNPVLPIEKYMFNKETAAVNTVTRNANTVVATIHLDAGKHLLTWTGNVSSSTTQTPYFGAPISGFVNGSKIIETESDTDIDVSAGTGASTTWSNFQILSFDVQEGFE